LLRFVDVLVVNEHELNDLAQLLGQESGDPVLDADALNIRLGLSVVCTLGENGSYISTKEGGIRVPARRVEVLDTTGAGDTFIGYLAASLAAKRDWRPALEEASAASAITVSRVGAARSIPCLDDVLALSAG
jgi:ribokinase